MNQDHNKIKGKSLLCWAGAYVFAAAAVIAGILPFIFMVLNSFKTKFEMLTKGVFSLPASLNFKNYQGVLQGGFVRYFGNSGFVLLLSLFLILFIAACASYPLARFRFRLNGLVFGLIVACMAIPIHITLIPVFQMTKRAGIYDSLWALIGPDVAFALPISVFILTNFMKGIPVEIEESAEMDGCSKYRMFFQIILPLTKPGISTLAIYNGVNIWNEFSFSYTLTQSVKNRTLPLAVWDFQGQYAMNTPMIMAVLTLTVLPMILLFIFAQDKLIKGMTSGAVKG
ncbi:carbohydrate ABC transporter permease [Lacrimispora brassicae]